MAKLPYLLPDAVGAAGERGPDAVGAEARALAGGADASVAVAGVKVGTADPAGLALLVARAGERVAAVGAADRRPDGDVGAGSVLAGPSDRGARNVDCLGVQVALREAGRDRAAPHRPGGRRDCVPLVIGGARPADDVPPPRQDAAAIVNERRVPVVECVRDVAAVEDLAAELADLWRRRRRRGDDITAE